MPTYDYTCPACGAFEAVRRIAERDDCACPACGAAAMRHTLARPQIPSRRATDPAVENKGSYGRMRHQADCACCPPTVP